MSIEPLESRIAPAFAAQFALASLNGHNGFQLSGVSASDQAGFSVSDAGDVNGDGFSDFIVGAPTADPNGMKTGVAYVVFGKAKGFPKNLDLSALNGRNGFAMVGEFFDDRAGVSVSSAGDVNGDGFDDVLVGAYRQFNDRGTAYVVFGKAEAFRPKVNLFSLNGVSGFSIVGAEPSDLTARSVSGAGDVNGDGFDDILVGAEQAYGGAPYSGRAYVIFGKGTVFTPVISVSDLNVANGFIIDGAGPVNGAGSSLRQAGDFNGDGIGDMVIGAIRQGPGAAYVIFGNPEGFPATLNLGDIDGTNGIKFVGERLGDRAGSAVSGAGDINGDGFDDLIIGAEYTGNNILHSAHLR